MSTAKPCEHLNFETSVHAVRIADYEDGPVNHFRLDISVRCRDCKTQFSFKGLPGGYDWDKPTISLDGFELRTPIKPGSASGLLSPEPNKTELLH